MGALWNCWLWWRMSLRWRPIVESASTSRISKGNKNANTTSNFNVTVLRVYWELGARTGTKIKLVVSTFTFWKHFLFSKQFSSPNLDKTVWLWIGFPINFTWYFRCEMGLIDENPKMRHQDLRYRHPPPTVSGRVPRAQLVWIWAPNSTSALCPGYTTHPPLRNRVLRSLLMISLDALLR